MCNVQSPRHFLQRFEHRACVSDLLTEARDRISHWLDSFHQCSMQQLELCRRLQTALPQAVHLGSHCHAVGVADGPLYVMEKA